MSYALKEKILPCFHEHRPMMSHHDHTGEQTHHHHECNIHRPQQRRALLISVLLTGGMMGVEFIAGLLTGSLMLISDAIHMLSHSTALGISLLAVVVAQKKVGEQFPFGLYRLEILAAFINGISLAAFSLWIVYEAVQRFFEPVAVLGPELTAVAFVGHAVNLTPAVILRRTGLEDINTKSAFLHMLADTFSSAAIIIGGVIISFTNWFIIDPMFSMFIAMLVAKWSWNLLRDSTLILMERKPDNIDTTELEKSLLRVFPEIRHVHDLHIWEITSQFVCMSTHLVLDDMTLSLTHQLRAKVTEYLRHHFGIRHVVIQFEC